MTPIETVQALVDALVRARQFIMNGVALGYIRMPDADCPDTAHQTPPMIDAAILSGRALLSRSPQAVQEPASVRMLTEGEQQHAMKDPRILSALMDYHESEQLGADAMGMECHGNEIRQEELKALGRAVIEQDPDIWDTEILRTFDIPVKVAAQPQPAGEVRMLTKEECHELAETVGLGSVSVQRKFCEVNKLKLAAAPAVPSDPKRLR